MVGADVVLTAAHCTDFLIDVGADGFGPDDLRISFDPEGDAPFYMVDHIVVHPDWLTAAPGRGNSKHLFLAPPAEDIALVFLDTAVAGVTPAPIADADYLAGLDLTSETFTVVGYGTDAYITGSAFANHPVVLFDGIRSYRDVSVITEHDAFPDRFLKITAGVCFGDSGGRCSTRTPWWPSTPGPSAPGARARTWSTGSTRPRPRPSWRPTCSRPSAPAAGPAVPAGAPSVMPSASLMTDSLDFTPSRMARSRRPGSLYAAIRPRMNPSDP